MLSNTWYGKELAMRPMRPIVDVAQPGMNSGHIKFRLTVFKQTIIGKQQLGVNSMNTIVKSAHAQCFNSVSTVHIKLKHFRINVFFTRWLLINNNTNAASA